MQRCKKEGIHTACETALYVPEEMIHQAAELLDQMYCDIKIFDSNAHKKLIGKNPKLIHMNLKWLLSGKNASKITVRTPLIPGMTNSKQNIHDIASWISSCYPDVKYEMLNYNELTPAKYPMTGKIYKPGTRKKLTNNQLQELRDIAIHAGIKNLL